MSESLRVELLHQPRYVVFLNWTDEETGDAGDALIRPPDEGETWGYDVADMHRNVYVREAAGFATAQEALDDAQRWIVLEATPGEDPVVGRTTAQAVAERGL